MTRRIATGALLAANLLPVALLFYFIHRYAVDVPLSDEWAGFVLQTLIPLDQGKLSLSTLFAQYNAHRIVFPRLLTLANAALFHWDRRVEVYVCGLLLVLAAAVVYRIARNYWNHRLAGLFFVPVAWSLMTWRQFHNLLFAFQTSIGFAIAGGVVAFWFLQSAAGTGKRIWLAAASAFVATFSFSAGLLIWPIGLVQLLIRQFYGEPPQRPALRGIGIWAGAGAASWAIFFTGHRAMQFSRPDDFVYSHPLALAKYIVLLLGTPLSTRVEMEFISGIFVLGLIAYALLTLFQLPKAHLVAAAPLLSLIAYALLSAAIISLGRVTPILPPEPSSRYCTFVLLGLVATYALLLDCGLRGGRPDALVACGGLLALLVIAVVTNMMNWSADRAAPRILSAGSMGKYVVRNAEVLRDSAIQSIQSAPERVRIGVPILRKHRYSLFQEPDPPGIPANYLGQSDGCSIDTVNGSVQTPLEVHRRTEDGLTVDGWAADLSASDLPARVFLSIDGRVDIPALAGGLRLDVARARNNPRYDNAGMISYPRLSLIPDGDHTLTLKIVNHDGSGFWTCTGPAARIVRVLE